MGPQVVAALGPTNTGKTHRALQRMREHETGMIGLPLRLLAREVYDKLVESVGTEDVALVTGEEKRIGSRVRYWVCTVEAMPMDVSVDFLAVDEIQLASHPERGHVFTDRLLRARGRKETWFLGAHTMNDLIQRLVPEVEQSSFPRLSALSTEGCYTLGSLPPRSAVVAFSVNRVYELAERLRARRGGAAIVLGALSPRARNAQVAMYQSGEVDYLVATDAIGMGLNLDITRVAFAETRKFDGQRPRALGAAELAQIAGRAGRYQSDGAFGTLKPCPPLSPPVERAIERHRFEPVRSLLWRNPELDFSSPEALLHSLTLPAPLTCLKLVAHPEDTATLELLLRRQDVVSALGSEADLRLLFELCQIPDYRKLLLEQHAQLVSQIFFEIQSQGRLRASFMEARLKRLTQHQGDIDSLTHRIAFIRTWTFVANHGGWLERSREFQAQTRIIEDQLSDALHAALVERFVKRQKVTSLPPNRPKDGTFRDQLRLLQHQLNETSEEPGLFERLCDANHDRFSFDPKGTVHFDNQPVATLERGRHLLEPAIKIFSATHRQGGELSPSVTLRSERRLRAFVKDLVSDTLGPLSSELSETLEGAGRGLVYQLRQTLGTVDTRQVESQIANLSPSERKILQAKGVRFGKCSVFLPSLLKKKAILRRVTLLRTHRGALSFEGQDEHTWTARPSFPVPPRVKDAELCVLGYRRVGPLAVRADILERLSEEKRRLSGAQGQRLITAWLGCKKPEARAIFSVL